MNIDNSSPLLKNLTNKMISIMDEVKYIAKTGFNQFHKYRYATEADIVSALSKALTKHNVFMFSSIIDKQSQHYQTRNNKDSFIVTVKLQVTFVDADSGENFSSQFYGDGSDPDDKGIYKAITGAQKYALMKTFLVATGDDPEKHDSTTEKSAPPAPPTQKTAEPTALIAHMTEAANAGSDAFRRAWKVLTAEQKNLIKNKIDFFKQLSDKADQSNQPTEEPSQ